jgi:hypothetical protein
MHQISLLGGLGNGRHGGGSHFMRPDRVARTGVLQPMTGYVPGYDTQMVATEFIIGPRGMTLSGLRGLRGWDKVKMWWHGVKMRASGAVPNWHAAPQAQAPTNASEKVLHAPGASPPPRSAWAGDELYYGGSMAPKYSTAYTVGPLSRGIPGAAVTRAYGMSSSLPGYAQDAMAKTTMMRWRGLRYPWG